MLATHAEASTSVVLALPSSASPTLLGASSDGEDIAYLAVPLAGGGGGERELHWYDVQTGEDVTVGPVADTDIGQISADGRHLVFAAWGSGPPGADLVVGTVYEATVGEDGQVTYEQVSPTAPVAAEALVSSPGGGGPPDADSPPSPSPNPRLAHKRSKCRKGFEKKVVKGKVKCVKFKHHRKRK